MATLFLTFGSLFSNLMEGCSDLMAAVISSTCNDDTEVVKWTDTVTSMQI